MFSRFLSILILTLCIQTAAVAEVRSSVEDKVIAATLRTFAKTYLATADVEKLKRNNVEKINRMTDERFGKRYAKVYKTLKDLPPKLKDRYAINETMTKDRAVRDIASLDKNKISEIIDAVPDAVIADEFRRHLSKEEPDAPSVGIPQRINDFWDGVMNKIDRSSDKP